MQTGDSYALLFEASDTATHNSTVSVGPTIAHGGPVPLGPLPTPWSYSGPTPAAFPTFVFDTYSGFAGQMPTQEVILEWPVPTYFGFKYLAINVTATASFLDDATAPMTIPDLTAIPGFLSMPNSGTSISWNANISVSQGGTISSVGNQGTYPEP